MIIPQYNLKDEKTTLTVDKLSDVSEESLEKMRRYLLNAKKVEAILDEEQRGKIQDSITEEITAKTLDANLFKQKMEVAKLLAQSQGSSVIKL